MENDRMVYEREPASFYEGIPVFSETDEYVDNYVRISNDHLRSYREAGNNPFIPEDLWLETEQSTRDLVVKYSGSGAMILDVGVGMGRLLSPLSHAARYGMDISGEYLKIARSHGIDVCLSRIEDMPYRKELFDLVVCTDVVEHVIDLNLCCRKILSVLKLGGTLIVRVPYRENLSFYLDKEYPYKFAHLRNFDEHTIRILFEKVFGCEFIELTSSGYLRDRNRLKYRLPRGEDLMMRLISYTRHGSRGFHQAVLKAIFHPVEFNVAFRKRS